VLQDSLVRLQPSVVLRHSEAVFRLAVAVRHLEEARCSAVVQCSVVSHSLVLQCLEHSRHSQQQHSAAVVHHSGPETAAGMF